MLRRYGKIIFLMVAAAVVAVSLYVANGLIHDLSVQERERMQIWADATKEIVSAVDSPEGEPAVDIDFLLRIISSNTTIPVLLTDDQGNILRHRNFSLPEPYDTIFELDLSEANQAFLERKLRALSQSPNRIDIVIAPDEIQHLYYEDSTLLKRLSYFPYVQLIVMVTFIAVVYFAVLSTKKAEQNKVWIGLSKETAHQLGTPISSLMAWMELLADLGVDPDTVAEMNKDVTRLSTIASRFGKIGSRPQMERADLNAIVASAVGYMQTRISPRIALTYTPGDKPLPARVCRPLFEWVMENLIKNAVDAMAGSGSIHVTTDADHGRAIIEVADTGKGIAKRDFKRVFSAGYTTKERGWGLGLTLAKRIIDQYHSGHIFVARSTPGQGTTFRIEIPLIQS